MTGLPMGWAWAPIIAQFSAEGVAEKIFDLISNLVLLMGVDGLVYIDNIILALDEDAAKVAMPTSWGQLSNQIHS